MMAAAHGAVAAVFASRERRKREAYTKKLFDVIDSCTTVEHLMTAHRYAKIWMRRHPRQWEVRGWIAPAVIQYIVDKYHLLTLQGRGR